MTAQQKNEPSDRSTETRGRILDAALSEFSANGLAGARTESKRARKITRRKLLQDATVQAIRC